MAAPSNVVGRVRVEDSCSAAWQSIGDNTVWVGIVMLYPDGAQATIRYQMTVPTAPPGGYVEERVRLFIRQIQIGMERA